mmetsp:Transcript_83252/g.166601  ORF Transcript_83252/g.166601 Transcript_83252/m.166601 type:complete len:307 (-) Transcript_83252:595-1515(-)
MACWQVASMSSCAALTLASCPFTSLQSWVRRTLSRFRPSTCSCAWAAPSFEVTTSCSISCSLSDALNRSYANAASLAPSSFSLFFASATSFSTSFSLSKLRFLASANASAASWLASWLCAVTAPGDGDDACNFTASRVASCAASNATRVCASSSSLAASSSAFSVSNWRRALCRAVSMAWTGFQSSNALTNSSQSTVPSPSLSAQPSTASTTPGVAPTIPTDSRALANSSASSEPLPSLSNDLKSFFALRLSNLANARSFSHTNPATCREASCSSSSASRLLCVGIALRTASATSKAMACLASSSC